MSHILIDRRENDRNRNLINRNRYLRRVRESVREAVRDTIINDSVKDTLGSGPKKIKIKKTLERPEFTHQQGSGNTDVVLSGNKQYRVGDRFKKPQGSADGKGNPNNKPGGDENGLDVFEFTVTKEEFFDIFFEDLELPNRVKKELQTDTEYVFKRAGITTTGTPNKLNIIRSMKQAKARRIALVNPKKKKLKELEKNLAELDEQIRLSLDSKGTEFLNILRDSVLEEIKTLKKKIKKVPFIDNIDLRYNYWAKKPQPATKAVVFSMLDVSGSMGEWEKEMAKRFFILALLFLEQKYETVDLVWIRHTDTASECTEDEFFHSKDTGGTVVSSALNLMHQIQKDRFPESKYNIYGIQISDGDNSHMDNAISKELLEEKILPVCQYFIYTEVSRNNAPVSSPYSMFLSASSGSLYGMYMRIASKNKNMVVDRISGPETIYPVFRKLFEKKSNA